MLNENENTIYQYLWDAAKAMLGGKIYNAEGTYQRKRSKINHLSFHFTKLKKKIGKLNPTKQKK